MRRLLPALLLAAPPVLHVVLQAVLAPQAAAQELPAAIAAFGAEASGQCTEMGGTPRIGPAFATAVDLNGDGRLDHVVDLAGVECAGAWSAFCGSAGCPVSVWIEGPDGARKAWSDYAQAWTIDGAGPQMAVVVTRHGAACPDSASGAETCSQRLTFEAPAAGAAPSPAAPPMAAPSAGHAPEAPLPEGWTLRAVPEGDPVAVSGGAGPIRDFAIFCLAGQPFLAATWAADPAPDSATLGFAFASAGTVTLTARREEGAGGALVAALRDQPLAARLAGRDSATELTVDGAPQGRLSLRGSTRAIRGALQACMPL